ncbi:5-hydroxytryptamine receptor 3B-like [Acipenser oxyrinchus oxyrinchus]|uniref:5-hydroxytryptamine receptor 3B-like n=1 Tax=Acipenser oxyrinchus oxyrinchus TaxID=40147 RepID=A0AAD8CHJ3_ACIOX|nr:5-hydroxytryptamine receptor 3B-like [Acipenser oxyrinchus oxyrinchus]
MAPVIFLLFLLLSACSRKYVFRHEAKKSALHQLTKSLLRNYRKGVRPVRNWTQSTMVYIDFITQSILEVDGKNQKMTLSVWYRQIWNDEFLVWDPAEFDGINEISLSFDAIWVPDVIISEFVDVGSSPDMPYVYVNSSGMIKNYRPIQVVSACSLEIYAFPFDRQNCTLTFRSWLHTVNEVNLTLWRSLEDVENDKSAFMNEGEWELISVPSRYEQLHIDSRDYAQIQFNVVIRRRPLLYVVSLLIPSLFLMIVDVMSFYLPANSGTRITFKTSILLGYTLFRVNISNELPATAIKTPLIGVFFAVCMALLVLSLAKSILVVKLLYHSEKPVKDMSVSACLLDKYGSYSQSIKDGGGKAKVRVRYQFEVLPKVEMTPSSGELSKNILLEKILREIVALKHYLEQIDGAGSMTVEWLALCYKLDKFLFRLYLFILAIYISVLCSLWVIWSSPRACILDSRLFH